MRYLGMVTAVVSLLVQAGTVYAISFAPVRSVGFVAVEPPSASGSTSKQPIGLTIGLAASVWDLPDSPWPGYGVWQYTPRITPLVSVEYRTSSDWTIGGWYNRMSYDLGFTSQRVGYELQDIEMSGGFMEFHGTYDIPVESNRWSLSAQLGVQRSDYDYSVMVSETAPDPTDPTRPDPNATPVLKRDAQSMKMTKAAVWALSAYRITPMNTTGMGFGLTGGFGVAQGLTTASGATNLHALLGASVALTPTISLDASAWFHDFARSRGAKMRFTAGTTGRF